MTTSIEINNLHFSYGRTNVLNGINLAVPQGSIFGFLGRNGAGKTTTIKILLGLMKPAGGQCLIEGISPQTDEIAVRKIVGYMAEDQQMYGWMKIKQIVDWVAGFYDTWDTKLTNELLDMFQLSGNTKVKALSKGQNSRLALLLALGHRPKVVILDDPTLGLDPIARKDFLRHVINLLQTNGVTVFFSSHLLYEIEPVADYIAILDEGKILKTGKTDELREKIKRFIFTPKSQPDFSKLTGVLDVTNSGQAVSVTIEDCDEAKCSLIKQLSANQVSETLLNLDEIFEAYVIGNRGKEVKIC